MYGGVSGDVVLNDMWTFDINTQVWYAVPFSRNVFNPLPRTGASFVVYDRKLYMFSGYTSECDPNLYQYNVDNATWSIVTPNSAVVPFAAYTYCFTKWMDLLLLFGGSQWFVVLVCKQKKFTISSHIPFLLFYNSTETFQVSNSLWAFNITSSTWSQMNTIGKSPKARMYPSCQVVADTLVLGNGYDGQLYLDDFYSLSM